MIDCYFHGNVAESGEDFFRGFDMFENRQQCDVSFDTSSKIICNLNQPGEI